MITEQDVYDAVADLMDGDKMPDSLLLLLEQSLAGVEANRKKKTGRKEIDCFKYLLTIRKHLADGVRESSIPEIIASEQGGVSARTIRKCMKNEVFRGILKIN